MQYLKENLAVGRHGNTIAVGQCQGLVVVKHGVEILNPDGVDWAVQKQPDVVTLQPQKITDG